MNSAFAASAGVSGYFAARRAAMAVKQQDIQAKTLPEHWDDLKLVIFGLVLYALLAPQSSWLTFGTVPVAAAVYAVVAELPSLRTSLDNPTTSLKAVLGGAGLALAAGVWWLARADPSAIRPAAIALALAVAWHASDVVLLKVSKKQTPETLHIHHWSLGLALAAVAGVWGPWPARIVAGVGLAMFVHANAVYRLSSSFCGYRVPCFKTRYADVPRLNVQ